MDRLPAFSFKRRHVGCLLVWSTLSLLVYVNGGKSSVILLYGQENINFNLHSSLEKTIL